MMTTKKKHLLALGALVLMIAAGATGAWAAKGAGDSPLWAKRCDKDGKYCEVFQQLSLQSEDKKSTQRLIEFALGYPAKSKLARGVFILPLGIILDKDPPVVTIDGKPSFTFHVRYCDGGGCAAVIDVPDANVEAMKKGKIMGVTLETMAGRKINIEMSLDGFGALVDKLKG